MTTNAPHWQDKYERRSAVAEAEHHQFAEQIAVSAAESAVASARIADLRAAQQSAHRRWTTAHGQLTKARNSSNPERLAAAEEREKQTYVEFCRISDAGIDESLQINRAQLDRSAANLEQMRRAWAASDAALDALRVPRG